MPKNLVTGYQLDVIRALYHHPQGLSLKDLKNFTLANNPAEAIRGLRENHGFRGLLLTETIKRTGGQPSFGRYILTSEGQKRAHEILRGTTV